LHFTRSSSCRSHAQCLATSTLNVFCSLLSPSPPREGKTRLKRFQDLKVTGDLPQNATLESELAKTARGEKAFAKTCAKYTPLRYEIKLN